MASVSLRSDCVLVLDVGVAPELGANGGGAEDPGALCDGLLDEGSVAQAGLDAEDYVDEVERVIFGRLNMRGTIFAWELAS